MRLDSRFCTTLALAAAITLAGCSSGGSGNASNESAKQAPPTSKTAPAEYKVHFETTQGPFEIEVHKDWAPRAADRFYELVEDKFYDDAAFFRVLKGFAAQFGINKDPKVTQLWNDMRIVDDPVKMKNERGMVTFAARGPNTRTTQVFINLKDNFNLDGTGFAPFGKVAGAGMLVVDKLYAGYGESIPRGNGPDPRNLQVTGNEYLQRNFPKIDYIKTARIVK